MISTNEQTSRILLALCHGDRDAADKLLPIVYEQLRGIAGNYLRAERADHTLQPTALVHEAFLRIRQLHSIDFESRAHFCGVAAHVMRRVLIDHARQHGAEKRGRGRVRLELAEALLPQAAGSEIDLIELDDVLTKLAEQSPRHAQVVEMRFFAGLSVEETAEVLGVSPRTVKNDWRLARAWLLVQMEGKS